jgi:2-dehydropantoate 2-reductase
MRFIVYGAGAVGGVIGGRLHEHGHDTVLIARGEHGRAIRSGGLRVESSDTVVTLDVPVVERPGELDLGPDDVVIMAMKTQDSAVALDELALAAPSGIGAVACAQNGVENERLALRRFPDVYAIQVMLPATHLEPGAVQANASPVSGILDVGRYGDGPADLAPAMAAALGESTFVSVVRTDIMRWKYAKLLQNLGNIVQAAFAPSEGSRELATRARHEGRACLAAAGIEHASSAEDRERRGDLLSVRPIDGQLRGGGSTWQSLARGLGTLETDYLNGEISMIGRQHGAATPVNDALQRLARVVVRDRAAPESIDLDAFLAAIDDERGDDYAEVGHG